MSTQRRFTEKEIAQIFEEASKAQREADNDGPHNGLSMEELKQIGASTGISPEFIERAVSALNYKPTVFPVKKHLGIPEAVSRTLDLPDSFSTEDWEQLVTDLRDTFDAHGKIEENGSMREWTNGNLKALVESTGSGYRLRMRTRKGNMRTLLYLGIGYMGLAIIMMSYLAFGANESLPVALITLSLIFTVGFSSLASVMISQPRWALKRERQMKEICDRVIARTTKKTQPELGEQLEPMLDLEEVEALNDQLREYAMQKKRSRT